MLGFVCTFRPPIPQVEFCADSISHKSPLDEAINQGPCVSTHAQTSHTHVKDPVVTQIRFWWIMETLKYPACTTGWVARLSHHWFSPWKATQIPHGRYPKSDSTFD